MIISHKDLLTQFLLQILNQLCHINLYYIITPLFYINLKMQQILKIVLLINPEMSQLWTKSNPFLFMNMESIRLIIVKNVKCAEIASVSKNFRRFMLNSLRTELEKTV